MRHIEDVLHVDAVLDASFLSSFRHQVGEPDDGNPVLQMRRTDVVKHLPLLWSHEACRWADRQTAAISSFSPMSCSLEAAL